MTKRTISVIVTTFNRTIRLEENIKALLNQNLDADVEMNVIIVDDCSIDVNVKKIIEIARQSSIIKLVLNDTNKGLSGSRNAGASYANSEFLLFLDDDIIPEPNYVMGHLTILESQLGIATVGSLRFPPELTKNNNLMKYLSSRELRQRNMSQDFLNDLPAQYLGGGICGMRTSDYIVVGGFSESYIFYGGEDVQMGYSLKKNGVRIMYCPLAKADHHDTVYIDRYRIKYMEAGREGVRLMLSVDPHFFDNSNMRFLLQPNKNDSFTETIIRITIQMALNKYIELLLRFIVKATNRYSSLYSKYLYHILFACWMYAGLREDRSLGKSEVKYSN